MACSRTPNQTLRPACDPLPNTSAPLMAVLFDVARSAEPPIRVGRNGATALITAPETTLVATAGSPGP